MVFCNRKTLVPYLCLGIMRSESDVGASRLNCVTTTAFSVTCGMVYTNCSVSLIETTATNTIMDGIKYLRNLFTMVHCCIIPIANIVSFFRMANEEPQLHSDDDEILYVIKRELANPVLAAYPYMKEVSLDLFLFI